MSDVLALVSALQKDVARLNARIDGFEVREPSPDLDRALSIKETAAAIGKSAVTLRHWICDAQKFDRMQLGTLLRKDPTGHWVSSPRLVARWRQTAFRELQGMAR